MTPLALSGGCQASEMVCLVMSFAWMDDTGDGAREIYKKNIKKEKKTISVHCFVPVLCVIFSLGNTKSVFYCSPKSPSLCSCWESQTVGQATRQSLPFVFELGSHSKSEVLQSCMATQLRVWQRSIFELMVGIHKTDPISPRLTLTSQPLFLRAGKIMSNFIFCTYGFPGCPYVATKSASESSKWAQPSPFFPFFLSSRDQINWFSLKLRRLILSWSPFCRGW